MDDQHCENCIYWKKESDGFGWCIFANEFAWPYWVFAIENHKTAWNDGVNCITYNKARDN